MLHQSLPAEMAPLYRPSACCAVGNLLQSGQANADHTVQYAGYGIYIVWRQDHRPKMNAKGFNEREFFSRIDLSAIEDVGDKIAECEFFLGLTNEEGDRKNFRWLISAFLNAAYSYFETSALHAYFAFTDEEGEMQPDMDAVDVLRGQVRVCRDAKRPDFVKTAGLSPITKQLYEIRRKNTHHFPLSIMQVGASAPASFQFGSMRGDGEPVLPFCTQVMQLIRDTERELHG